MCACFTAFCVLLYLQYNWRTPLHYAAKYGHTDIFNLLEAHGGDVNRNDKVSYMYIHGMIAVIHIHVIHAHYSSNQMVLPYCLMEAPD